MVRLFDLKTGQRRDYRPQMAFYALGLMQRYDERECEVHLVYSKYKETDVYTISRLEAEETVYGIEARVKDPARKETLCDYCSWCGRRDECQTLTDMVKITLGEDFDSKDMGAKMDAARKVTAWAAGVKRKATEAARLGKVPSGYLLVSRAAGDKQITYLKKKEKDNA
jgi:hypothetical protein